VEGVNGPFELFARDAPDALRHRLSALETIGHLLSL
jgi:hypothetical protein